MSLNSLEEKITQAIGKRESLLKQYNAVRLFDGTGDGNPDLFIDKYSSIILIHALQASRNKDQHLVKELSVFDQVSAKNIYLRARYKDSAQSAQTEVITLKEQESLPVVIKEHFANYYIDPTKQINAGFFIDMRNVRKWIADNAQDKKVLNLFCYTGSLGISAYVGGASIVTQVDLSKGILSWARKNFELNGSDNIQGVMKFIPEDSLTFLEKEKRRISRGSAPYDVVIVDPPSFSRSPAGTFQIERDLQKLYRAILAVTDKGSKIILTTNLTSLGAEEIAERVCRESSPHSVELLYPPEDFTAPREASSAMRGVLVSL